MDRAVRTPPASPVRPCRPSPARSCWQPPLPGGWKAADPTYFIGKSETFDDGDKVVHGQQGEVVGPSTHMTFYDVLARLPLDSGEAYTQDGDDKYIQVKFPGNKGNSHCLLTELSRSPPVRARWCGGAVVRAAARASRGVEEGGGVGWWVGRGDGGEGRAVG